MVKPGADQKEDVGVVTAGALRIVNGVRRLPADLAVVVVVVCLADFAVLTPLIRETPLPTFFGLTFLLFVPGYTFVAALFPRSGDLSMELDAADATATEIELRSASTASRRIDWIERGALSSGLSVAISFLVGFGMNFTPWGIRPVPVLISLSVFTVVSAVVAARRRWALPTTERFQVSFDELLANAQTELFGSASRSELFLNILLASSFVIALMSVGWAVAAPQQGESFTEFYLLSESVDGELVAEEYPTEYLVGESRELTVGIHNLEGNQVDYFVLVRLQEVVVTDNSTSVLRSERLDAFQTTLSHNDTWHRRHTVTPTFPGTHLRLQYLLYRDEVPSEPSADSAYRDLRLWVNVTSPD